MRASLAFWGILFAGLRLACAQNHSRDNLVAHQTPQTLSFHDLIDLVADPPPPAAKAKLDRLLSEPFINNEALYAGQYRSGLACTALGRCSVSRNGIKRWSAEKLFDEQVKRQVRRGGRMAIVVDLDVPESPTGLITVVCPHLENYSKPKGRRKQMDYLLEQISGITNPTVIAGDLNTMEHNQAPTSVKQIILEHLTDYRFWVKETVLYLNPVGIYNYLLYPANYFKNYHDPTALNFEFFLPNHEKLLFRDVRAFRFDDGKTFDFRGDRARSVQRKGRTLSDSSQRAWKGFSTTFAFNRPLFHLVGHYKLDWFLVKPTQSGSSSVARDLLFAPCFARTMREVDEAVEGRISDHYPITVDLPLTAIRIERGPVNLPAISTGHSDP